MEARAAGSGVHWLAVHPDEYEPLGYPEAQVSGIERITAERQRQIEAEGWTLEHDDTHTMGELAGMASWYAQPIPEWRAVMPTPRWERRPGDRIRELEKAGALIAAEIDRLLRLGGSDE